MENEIKCECGMTLPFWATKMDDGNLRCQECKRVYTPDLVPLATNSNK